MPAIFFVFLRRVMINTRKQQMTEKKLKRKKRARSSPDMTELSLPKPASRLSNDLDLSGSALNRSFQMEHEMASTLGVALLCDARCSSISKTSHHTACRHHTFVHRGPSVLLCTRPWLLKILV